MSSSRPSIPTPVLVAKERTFAHKILSVRLGHPIVHLINLVVNDQDLLVRSTKFLENLNRRFHLLGELGVGKIHDMKKQIRDKASSVALSIHKR